MFRRFVQLFRPRHPDFKRAPPPARTANAKMSTAAIKARYLSNPMPDYKTGDTEVPEEEIKKQIFDYLQQIKTNIEPNERNGKDGLYLGTAGIAYMYYHISKVPALRSQKRDFLLTAVEYLKPALEVCTYEVNDKNVPAFLLGNCGVYAVASAIYKALGEEKQSLQYRDKYNEAAKTCKDINFLSAGSDELFVGRAGYVCGAIWMANETKHSFKADDIYDICRVMLTSGRQYSQLAKSPSPLMYSYYDVEYLGAGHGIGTILQVLMCVPGFLEGNPIDSKNIKDSVDYLLSLQDPNGNFPAATDEIKGQNNELVHWCHGASGIVYLMAKAYLIWKNEKYLKSCQVAADLVWEKGLLRKGPGLCHGVAGNGYVFLLLYRLTREQRYLHRAVQFSRFLNDPVFKEKARVPDNPYSLFEGIAGTVCFLGDLLEPDQASFPFTDIFQNNKLM